MGDATVLHIPAGYVTEIEKQMFSSNFLTVQNGQVFLVFLNNMAKNECWQMIKKPTQRSLRCCSQTESNQILSEIKLDHGNRGENNSKNGHASKQLIT